jgi:hypothetical protein
MGLNICNNQNPLEQKRTSQKEKQNPFVVWFIWYEMGLNMWTNQILWVWKKGPFTCCKHEKTKRKKWASCILSSFCFG